MLYYLPLKGGLNMQNFGILWTIARVLLLMGGINLGLYGLFKIDLITMILGNGLARLLYILMGVSAGFIIYYKVTKKDT